MNKPFHPRLDKAAIETGEQFSPKFDEHGLIPAIATDAHTGDVLMFAYMNEQALRLTLQTAKAHYFSRSRNKLWLKGEESGHVQIVKQLRTDCDQDVIWMKVDTQGAASCHVGFKSCFYRAVELGSDSGKLTHVGGEKLFDPQKIYGKK